MRYLLFVLLSFNCGAAQPDLSKAIQFPVDKYRLENGLTVLLLPDQSIPAVSVQTWYRVGSKDEWPGRTGLAHFFEHMMFKGTKKFDKDTFGKFLAGKGAEDNAFTSFDYTGYYINAPAENLDLLLQIESDRMRNLSLDEKDVKSEREVVKEERRMRYEDNVEGGIHEKMYESLFTSLPYHWIPIGSMVDLNAASMADLHKFYKSFYSPNNAVLLIGGDFKAEQVKKLIEKYYAALPREDIERPPLKAEAPQTEVRKAVIEREAQAPSVAIGYRLPNSESKDWFALDLLSIVLGQGQSSRLYKQLVYKAEMAIGAGAYTSTNLLAGQFGISVSLKPNGKPERAVQLVETEVEMLRERLISQKELDKARNMFMKDYVDGMKRMTGKVHAAATAEMMFGDYRRLFSDLVDYQKVTPEDIKRVARTYLQPQFRNIVTVVPKPGGGVL